MTKTRMWIIRKEQMAALREPLIARFHRELLSHLRSEFVEETGGRSDEEILQHIRHSIGRAALYGIKTERDLYMYVNISMVYGPDFDQAEASRWTRRFLLDRNVSNPSRRMDLLYEETMKWLAAEESGEERTFHVQEPE